MGRVVVPDVVALEATRLQDKPWAIEVEAWLATGVAELVETELGSVYRLAIERGLRPPRHSGEISIIEWLHSHLTASSQDAIVVFEDARVPRMLGADALGDLVPSFTTWDFLEFAQDRGIIPSVAAAYKVIEERIRTASRRSFHGPGKPEP